MKICMVPAGNILATTHAAEALRGMIVMGVMQGLDCEKLFGDADDISRTCQYLMQQPHGVHDKMRCRRGAMERMHERAKNILWLIGENDLLEALAYQARTIEQQTDSVWLDKCEVEQQRITI